MFVYTNIYASAIQQLWTDAPIPLLVIFVLFCPSYSISVSHSHLSDFLLYLVRLIPLFLSSLFGGSLCEC